MNQIHLCGVVVSEPIVHRLSEEVVLFAQYDIQAKHPKNRDEKINIRVTSRDEQAKEDAFRLRIGSEIALYGYLVATTKTLISTCANCDKPHKQEVETFEILVEKTNYFTNYSLTYEEALTKEEEEYEIVYGKRTN